MDRRVALLLVGGGSWVGCGERAGRPMGPPPTSGRNLQIVVQADAVGVYHANDEDCWCPTSWPGPDEGALAYIDSGECTCDPLGCIEAITLSVDGEVVERRTESWWGELLSYGTEHFDLPVGEASLAFEGCGETAEVPIARSTLAEPTGTRLWASGSVLGGVLDAHLTLGVSWDTEPDVAGSILQANGWHDGRRFRSSEPDPALPWVPWYDTSFSAGVLGREDRVATAAGTMTVLPVRWVDLPQAVALCPTGADRWVVVQQTTTYSWTWPCDACPAIEHGGQTWTWVGSARFEFAATGGELWLDAEFVLDADHELRVLAGPAGDRIEIRDADGWWTGTAPHQPLPIASGVPMVAAARVAYGDLTLEDAAGSGATRVFTGVALSWEPLVLVPVDTGGGACG